MNSRERLMTSLAHREPDRVPMFVPNLIQTREPLDARVRQFFSSFPWDRFDKLDETGRHHRSAAEEERRPDERPSGEDAPLAHPADKRETAPGVFVDGYGCRYEYKGVGLPYCTYSPLAGAQTVADVEAFPWPEPQAPRLAPPASRQGVRGARANDERLSIVNVPPVFHQCQYLRGFEQWLLDIKLNPDVHKAIADRVCHIHGALLAQTLEDVGESVDMVMAGDDLGSSTSSYVSLDDFRELLKPYYRDLIQRVKNRFPHIKFYLHSHGQIMGLVHDLIECGVDVLNPILPLDNMDPVRLKREFGDQLCFHGGIDVEHILPFGTVAQARDHVRRTIDILAPGGGYWFKVQAVSPVIPPENVIAAHEEALAYGVYRSQ